MTPRRLRELQATALMVGTSLVAAIVTAAMLVSGWSGGRLDNRIEPLFWAGGILSAIGILLLGLAAMPSSTDEGDAGPVRRIRGGIALFLVGPMLAVVATFVDYWI